MLLQPSRRSRSANSRTYFSPLFVGDASATVPLCLSGSIFPYFSPLFVGDASATPSPAKPRPASEISVPSLSGMLLQRRERAIPPWRWSRISVPSLSGMLLQLVSTALPGRTAGGFQSPLCRGCFCNKKSTATARAAKYFSPLFVGDASATRQGYSFAVLIQYFSPLFVGDASATAPLYACFQRDTSDHGNKTSQTPNLHKTPVGLRNFAMGWMQARQPSAFSGQQSLFRPRFSSNESMPR